MEGYIWIHRKILDNPIVMKDTDHFVVWMYLLLNASHKGCPVIFNGKKTMLKAGQLITGRKKIAEKTGINESKVNRILKTFKSDQQIEQQTCPQNSLITILNWDKYQYCEQQNEQQVNNEWTTSEQRVNTNNNVNNVNKVKKKGFSFFDSRDYDFEELEKRIIK